METSCNESKHTYPCQVSCKDCVPVRAKQLSFSLTCNSQVPLQLTHTQTHTETQNSKKPLTIPHHFHSLLFQSTSSSHGVNQQLTSWQMSGVYNRTNPHQAMFYTWSVCQGNKLSLSLTHASAANSHTYTNIMLQIHKISLIITHMKPHSLSQSILDLVWQLALSASPHADG